MGHKKRETTVTANTGFRSIKTTELYTPDTAPINYIDSEEEKEDEKPLEYVESEVEAEPSKPAKELSYDKSFFEGFSNVYISGRYPLKGNNSLKIKEIISLIVANTGGYHIRVNKNLKEAIKDIILFGDSVMLGRKVSSHEREVIIKLFKQDNI